VIPLSTAATPSTFKCSKSSGVDESDPFMGADRLHSGRGVGTLARLTADVGGGGE
jgi:hypothetical protein